MVKYRQASFRGVTFEVQDRSFTSGRRVQVHEYPNKDTPYTEDLGKKTQNFQVQAFVIGDTYASRRDALIRACERQGAGILIHPDYGTKNVICDGVSVKESSDQRRMAVIDLTFIEAGEKVMPSIAMDWIGSIISSARALMDSARDSFVSIYAVSSGIASLTGLVGEISDTCLDALNGLNSGIGYASGLKSDITNSINAIADAVKKITGLKDNAKSYVTSAVAMADTLSSSYSTVTELAGKSDPANSTAENTTATATATTGNTTSTNETTVASLDSSTTGAPAEAFQTVRQLASSSNASETANDSTEEAKAEKLCMQQLEQYTKQIVVAQEAQIITDIEFKNAEEANNILDAFLKDAEEVELFEDVEPSNEIMQALRDLRRDVVEYMREIIINLPQTKTITLGETTPSLALAYDLYEDLERADEIVKRNGIKYPQFIPANKELKVLTK
ncbi:MAG: DNA circularization N-terminal domain-containing protein [Alphaproteobacteria bacterium]|nr:DNA circularization N-terminal domain-containing protein [Alphaproteobacteria bacterium]